MKGFGTFGTFLLSFGSASTEVGLHGLNRRPFLGPEGAQAGQYCNYSLRSSGGHKEQDDVCSLDAKKAKGFLT